VDDATLVNKTVLDNTAITNTEPKQTVKNVIDRTSSHNLSLTEDNDKVKTSPILDEIQFDKKGINFMHLNIHYLYPKIDEGKHLVDKYQDIDILGLLETFLSDVFSDSEIC
jgi:hypothetical protein